MTNGRERPARTKAINRFLDLSSTPDAPAMSRDMLADYHQCKPEVYAAIGVVAANLIDDALTPELLERLRQFNDWRKMDWAFREALDNRVDDSLAAYSQRAKEIGTYTHVHHGAQLRVDSTPENELLRAGVWTYRKTTSGLYTKLSEVAPTITRPQLAGSYRLLDKLAKLSVPMLLEYTNQYIFVAEGESTFGSHIEPTRDGMGYQFKPNAILNAATEPWRDEQTIGELRDTGATVGCPVTFRPGTTRRLWEFYAEARFGCEDNAR